MQAKKVDVGQGVSWISCGFRIFMKNPGVWVVLAIILLGIAVVLSFIPIVGPLALSLISPVLGGGLLYAARESDQGRDMDIAQMFQGFREKGKLTPLLSLGGIALLAGIVSAVIAGVVVGGAMMTVMGPQGQFNPNAGMPISVLLAALLMLAIQLLVAMALFYATPLVMLKDTRPGEAIRASFNGCLSNILPLFVFGLIYFLLAILASLPFFLGWLVLLPASVGMVYCSYRDLFE